MNPSSEAERACPKCGRNIPSGQTQCVCVTRPRYWLHSRETILLLAFVGLGTAFAVTGFAARLYHDQRRALAEEWHRRGVTDLAANRAEAALLEFRTAMIYARENIPDEQQQGYQLDLADALMAAERADEARSYLLDLWQRTPGNSKINLDLARLAAHEGDDEAARRYYEGAINGVWEGTPDQVTKERLDARLELYRYLMTRGDASAAQSALLAAATSLPADAGLNVLVGQLMLESGQARQALVQFQQALGIDRRDKAALVGAGMASFDLGDDAATVRYLEDFSREKPEEPKSESTERASRTLAVAQMTLAIDPLRTGLNAQERAQRTVRSYDAAVSRLESCAMARNIALPKVSPKNRAGSAQTNDLAGMYVRLIQMRPSVQESNLVRRPEDVEPALNLAFAAEAAVTEQCGSPQDAADEALARIAGRTQGGRP